MLIQKITVNIYEKRLENGQIRGSYLIIDNIKIKN